MDDQLLDAESREARSLILALIEGLLSGDEVAKLERLLASRAELRRYYIRMVHVHAGLYQHASILAPQSVRLEDELVSESPNLNDAMMVPAIREAQSTEVEPVSLATLPAPAAPSVPPRWWQRRSSWWQMGAIAAGVGLLAVLWPRSKPSAAPLASHPLEVAQIETVGSINGSVDAEWASADQPRRDGDSVPSGKTLELTSGVAEIGLSSNARLVCQGPVRFTVDSPTHVSVQSGNLVARIKGGGLVVQTPAMTVTDLGTEFGVHVESNGTTELAVFEGSVRVSGNSIPGTGKILSAGDKLQQSAVPLQTAKPFAIAATQFVRVLPPRTESLDLVDMVAGGNGTGHHRGWGMDLSTGSYVDSESWPGSPRSGSGLHAFPRGAMLDSCLVVPADGKPTPVDTHNDFFTFPAGDGVVQGAIWAGAAPPALPAGQHINATLGGINFSGAGHAMLLLHPNSAITFSLGAIRARTPQHKQLEFIATIGKPGLTGSDGAVHTSVLNAYVLINGTPHFQKNCPSDGRPFFRIDLTLDDSAQFLTLATTGASLGAGDGLLVGDPIITAK